MPKFKITRTCEAVYETIVEAIDAETAHGIALELDSAEDYRLVAEHEEHDEPIPFDADNAPVLSPPTERYIADKIKALETSHDDLLACLRNLIHRELIIDTDGDHFEEALAVIDNAHKAQNALY